MTSAIGTRLGPYEILSLLGAGGMGDVYRARDTKLNRAVAIKILPEAFAEDEERVGRFKREAQVLASLNHPNIAAIYGVEESDGIRALVMELIKRPTLTDRIAAGDIPIDEALSLARQIAEAIEAAHERGVIHRDLKPANVKASSYGTVKVLDFGLAKVLEEESPSTDLSHSPTLIKGTQAGVILGTAAYMSPEQAKGKTVDKRSDIWAFGCVLFEMLSGQQTFSGETLTDTLAAVVRAEPEWSALPTTTPAAIRRLLERCLTKDPRRRLRDIGEARIAIESVEAGKSENIPDRAARKEASPSGNALVLVAGVVLACLAGAVGVWFLRPAGSEVPLRKLDIHVQAADLGSHPGYSISPDGRMIAYISNGRLWIRDLDRLEPREVANTKGAQKPFWSPDSSTLGYVIEKRIWKVSSSGSGSTAIAELPDIMSLAGGASWRPDGTIIFATGLGGLMQISAQGGTPSSLLEVGRDESDFHTPMDLPGGRGVLFSVHRGPLGVDTLVVFDGKTRRTVLHIAGAWISEPAYSPTGHILFDQVGAPPVGIWALPFSLDRLEATGEPFLVAPDARVPRVSDDGTLVFAYREEDVLTRLVWVDRLGKVVSRIQTDPLPFQRPATRLSPDGKRVVLAVNTGGVRTDSWVVDLTSSKRTRISFENIANGGWFCSWTPDGKNVLYLSGASLESLEVLSKAVDGSGTARQVTKARDANFSPDGRYVIYTTAPTGYLSSDIWYRETAEGAQPVPFVVTPRAELSPEFSPDGRYVAYISNESGREEVYVRSFPGGEGKWQASTGGGSVPRWSRRGDELFFFTGSDLIVVSVRPKPSLELGAPRKLFSYRPLNFDRISGIYESYDVSPDGQRFVMLERAPEQTPSVTLAVIQNWFAEFKDKQK